MHTLERLVTIEHLDERQRAEQVAVLGGDLDDNLEVLAHVGAHHLVEARYGLFLRKTSEVVDEPVDGEDVGVHDRALDVRDVLVVFERLYLIISVNIRSGCGGRVRTRWRRPAFSHRLAMRGRSSWLNISLPRIASATWGA